MRGAILCGGLLALLAGCEFFEGLTGSGPASGAGGGQRAATSGPATVDPEDAPKPLTVGDRQLSGAMEGVYQYTDAAGELHFVDSIEKVPPRYRKKAVHPTGGALTVLPSTPIDELIEKEKIDVAQVAKKPRAAGGGVILYTTSWCPFCTRARDHLRTRGVSFVEKDVERDRAALEEMVQKVGGRSGVPVIDVRGTILRGFSPQALDQALGN